MRRQDDSSLKITEWIHRKGKHVVGGSRKLGERIKKFVRIMWCHLVQDQVNGELWEGPLPCNGCRQADGNDQLLAVY